MKQKHSGTNQEVWPDRTVRSLKKLERPLFVKEDDPVETALTTMLWHDFSQLPVLDAQNRAVGVVRWPVLVKRLLDGEKPNSVRDWKAEAQTISADRSIHDAVDAVLSHEYVLVTESDGQVCGIITAWDLTRFAERVLMPFLVVEDIELALRRVIEERKPPHPRGKAPERAKDGQWVAGLPELINVLNDEDNWAHLGTKLSREVVVASLESVRKVRNRLMHFAVGEALNPLVVQDLKIAARFLREVGLVTPRQTPGAS